MVAPRPRPIIRSMPNMTRSIIIIVLPSGRIEVNSFIERCQNTKIMAEFF